MHIKYLWPGKTRSPALRAMEELYLGRIAPMAEAEVIVTRTASGLDEKAAAKIMEIEAEGLAKHLDGAYIICLTDKGRQMTSEEFAVFLSRREMESAVPPAFVVGGFLGLADRVLAAADMKLSLSRMTFTHELCRVMLLEQTYRALTIKRGKKYAK